MKPWLAALILGGGGVLLFRLSRAQSEPAPLEEIGLSDFDAILEPQASSSSADIAAFFGAVDDGSAVAASPVLAAPPPGNVLEPGDGP